MVMSRFQNEIYGETNGEAHKPRVTIEDPQRSDEQADKRDSGTGG